MKDNDTWRFEDAESDFNQLVEAAIYNTPQFVIKNGS